MIIQLSKEKMSEETLSHMSEGCQTNGLMEVGGLIGSCELLYKGSHLFNNIPTQTIWCPDKVL